MANFKVLKYNQIFMAKLGLYSYRLMEDTSEFFTSISSYYILLGSIVAIISSGVFIMDYWRTDIKGAVAAFKIFIGAIQYFGVFANLGLQSSKIKALHNKLQTFVDSVQSDEVHDMYWANELRCRKYTFRIVCYVIFHTSAFTIVLAYAFFCILVGNYDTSSWFLSFDVVLPFDNNRLLGWFLTWFCQFSMASGYSLCMISMTTYFLSCCFYICTMCKHFKIIMHSVQKDVERNKFEKSISKIKANRQRILNQLIEAVKLHNEVLEFFDRVKDIFSFAIFSMFPINALFLSVSICDLEWSVKHFEPWVLIFDLSCILCALVWPAALAYYSNKTTDYILSIGDIAFESNWFDYFPLKHRKYTIFIIMRCQNPIFFTGLSVIYCTLNNFGLIVKAACSYYLAFRTLAQNR